MQVGEREQEREQGQAAQELCRLEVGMRPEKYIQHSTDRNHKVILNLKSRHEIEQILVLSKQSTQLP